MHPARYTGRLRRGAAYVALGVMLLATMFTLSQCKMVGDSLTGVSLEKIKPENCIAQCSKTYNDSIRVESDLHVTNVHTCMGDSLCLALEEMRHEAEVRRIQDQRKICQDFCHHQGSGGGR